MPPRVNLVTLGVADVAAATAFYERLGLRRSSASVAGTTFFQLGPLVLSLFGRAALAADAGVADTAPGFSGITLAHNLDSRAEVVATYEAALAAGARPVKPPQVAEWGGFSGYFADPDGHLWEVAHNPFWPFDAAGMLRLPT